MKILITGAKGQLATEFIEYFEKNGISINAFSREDLDITGFNKVYSLIKEIEPDIVINCSAYNMWMELKKSLI
jgi:dTDP-4-dehydrorhamnose reductase